MYSIHYRLTCKSLVPSETRPWRSQRASCLPARAVVCNPWRWESDEPSSPRPGWLGHDPLRSPLSNPLVWPRSNEVCDVFLDHPMKLPVPDNQQVIEAFSPHAPQEPFADRVSLWSAVGRLQPALSPPGQGTSMELALQRVLTRRRTCCPGRGSETRVSHRSLPRLLRHPGVGRVGVTPK
jgi:hypothetical protein